MKRWKTKSEIVVEICHLIGLAKPLPMSTGSTEPRQLFASIDDVLGLGASKRGGATKPKLAAAIVESAGLVWLPHYESRGSTVTREGLLAVLDAVKFFCGEATKT